MTRIIGICSGKGGVGKTTLVSNLGANLANMGHDVIILDANLTTPNLGIHLGIPLFPKTLQDVMKGNANIQEAIYNHSSGLRIVPAGISLRDLKGVDSGDLSNVVLDLLGNSEILILDGAAGLGRETLSTIESSDELLIVTNPELTSVTDALKTIRLAERFGSKITGVVINRVSNKGHQMTTKEVQDMLGDVEILAEIPEDIEVQRAISKRNPVVLNAPNSRAGIEIRKLAGRIVGKEIEISQPWYRRILGR